MRDIREGFQVTFAECGHTMAYDKYSVLGPPDLGEVGRCRQCADAENFLGVDRVVVALRQCWIETTTRVHLEKPAFDRAIDKAQTHRTEGRNAHE